MGFFFSDFRISRDKKKLKMANLLPSTFHFFFYLSGMICRLICRISTPTTGKQDDVSSSVERKVFNIVLSLVCLLGLNFFWQVERKSKVFKSFKKQ